MTTIRYALAVLAAVACLAAGAPAEKVKVERKTAGVTRKTFDPARPPADMPPLKPGEDAQAVDFFSIHVEVDVQVLRDWKKGAGRASSSRVTGVRLTTGLEVTIWLPARADAALKAHEEGHRQISEHFYGDAETVAREIGRAWLGKTIEGEGVDEPDATRAAIDAAIQRMADDYLDRTQARAQRVHELYDEITRHGRDRRVSVEDGVKRALEREKQK